MKISSGTKMTLLALAVLGVGVSCKEPPARVAPPPPKVNVAHPVLRQLIDSDDYNGWVDATATVEVRARVRGHIHKVGFTDGQIVAKDQLLFELDPRPFEANVARAKDELKVYEAQASAAQKEETRLKDLLTKGGASKSQVEKAEADRISFEAQIEGAKQEIKRQELELEYSKITAPIAGRISKAELTEGNLVNAGGSDPVLTTIVAVNPMDIYFSVDERAMQRYLRMRPLPPAGRSGDLRAAKLDFHFGLETDTGFPMKGQLDFADNKVDKLTGTIILRGTADNTSGLLVPGSRVKVRVPTSEPKTVSLVDDTAILSDQSKRYVLIVDDKKVVHRRDIELGRLLDDGMRIVLPTEKGPAIGKDEWIIVQGTQMARLNYPVDPIPVAEKPTSAPAVIEKPAEPARTTETKPETKAETKAETKPEAK
jgi:RND family efflux transporter MFP subunit